MKKVGYIIGIVVLIGVVIFAFTYKKDSPRTTVENMLTNLKNGNFENISEYVNYDELMTSEEEEKQDLFDSSEENLSLKKALYSNMEFEIVKTGRTVGNAYVDAKITNKNIKEIFSKYLDEFIKVAFSSTLSSQSSDSNLEEKMKQYLVELFNSGNIESLTTEVRINLKKEDRKWKVIVDENLRNAIFPGFNE